VFLVRRFNFLKHLNWNYMWYFPLLFTTVLLLFKIVSHRIANTFNSPAGIDLFTSFLNRCVSVSCFSKQTQQSFTVSDGVCIVLYNIFGLLTITVLLLSRMPTDGYTHTGTHTDRRKPVF